MCILYIGIETNLQFIHLTKRRIPYKYLCSRDRSSITDAGWLELYSSRLFTRIAERHFIEHKIAIGCPAITQGKHSEQHPSIRNNSHDRLMR